MFSTTCNHATKKKKVKKKERQKDKLIAEIPTNFVSPLIPKSAIGHPHSALFPKVK
jgi:hypothetical protein